MKSESAESLLPTAGAPHPEDRAVQVTPQTGVASDVPAGTDTPPLSKKAQKKLAKAAYFEERKKERRAAEKERRKEKKRLLAEQRPAGEPDAEDEQRDRKRQKTDKGPRVFFGARVVVDLGFDEKMTENEVKSLTSQLAYTYSANRKAEHPFSSLLFTSLDGRTLTRMDATNNAAYKRWVGAEWWTEGYERLWDDKFEETQAGAASVEGETTVVRDEGEAGRNRTTSDVTRSSKKREPSRAAKETVVYLTADSEDELAELKEGETYIIGGIVDHNRYKNLCLDKSKEHHIRSARLPIGTYLSELRTRKVLTVNQTFEILLKWVETRDWEQALYSVIPKRKFNAGGRRRGGGGASSKGGESVDEDEGEEAEEGSGGAVDGEVIFDTEAKVIDVAALEAGDPTQVPQRGQSKTMDVDETSGK
ncbi:guanine-1-methyltransferase-domain-containing protein [Trametes meyenii]|nr:guanine-1-methyltransferase-domain-containing protein [Trametes meyenii]